MAHRVQPWCLALTGIALTSLAFAELLPHEPFAQFSFDGGNEIQGSGSTPIVLRLQEMRLATGGLSGAAEDRALAPLGNTEMGGPGGVAISSEAVEAPEVQGLIVSAWVRAVDTSSHSNQARLLFWRGDGGGVELRYREGRFSLILALPGGVEHQLLFPAVVPDLDDGEWHWIVVSWSGREGMARLYAARRGDETLFPYGERALDLAALPSFSAPLLLGNAHRIRAFHGWMDQVRLYLSPEGKIPTVGDLEALLRADSNPPQP